MVELFANGGDPDQMPYSAASDLGLHCLPFTLLGVSKQQWDRLDKLSNLKIEPGPDNPDHSMSHCLHIME